MQVVAFPLFDVLDGKTSSDYEQRVEPSVTGGRKIAAALLDAILPATPHLDVAQVQHIQEH